MLDGDGTKIAWDSLCWLHSFWSFLYISTMYADVRQSQAKWPWHPYLWQDEEDCLGVLCFKSTYLSLWSFGSNFECLVGGRRWNPLGDLWSVSEMWTTNGPLDMVVWIYRANLNSTFLSKIYRCSFTSSNWDIGLLCYLNIIFLYCWASIAFARGNVDKVLSMSCVSVTCSPHSLNWANMCYNSKLNDKKIWKV